MSAIELKILIIDDDPNNIRALRAAARKAFPGCRCWSAGSGAEGIEITAMIAPDVLLLDLALPDLDGLEMLRRLRAGRRSGSIPAICLTTPRTSRDARARALRAGAAGFLPSRPHPLELRIAVEAIARHGSARARRRSEDRAASIRKRLMADAAQAFSMPGDDPQTVLNELVELICRGLAYGCLVRLRSDDGAWLHPAAARFRGAAEARRSGVPGGEERESVDGERPFARVVKTGKPLRYSRLAPEQLPELEPSEGPVRRGRARPRSAMIVPLRVEGRAIGALGLVRRLGGLPPFSLADLGLAQRIANRAALAIEHARVHGRLHAELARRRQVEADLKRSEALFAAIFRSSPIGINIFRISDNRSVLANDAFLRLTGYARDELEGRSAAELNLFVDSQLRDEWMATLRAGGSVYGQDARIRTKSGEVRHTLASLQFLAVGEEPMVLVVVTDVTERRRAEEEVRQSHQLFSNAFHLGPAGRAITSIADGRFVDVNESFLQTFELSRTEVIGRTPLEIGMLTPQAYAALNEAQRATGGLRGVEAQASTSSGEIKTILLSSRPMEVRGEPCLISTLIDISPRRRVEQSLRESEARYRNILEAAPVGIAIHQGGRIEFINPAGLRILGAESSEQLIGKSILELFHPASRETAADRIRRMMGGERGIYPVEDRYVRLDGSVVDVEVMATPLTYNGKPAVQVIVADISGEKRYRDELARLNTELEERVRNRTAELEAANRELEAFSYSVSHDLRAPLRAVDGYTQLLLEEYHSRLDEEGRRICRIISDSSRDMGRLIDDLLAFSRVGRSTLQSVPVDMRTMARSIFFELANAEQRERIAFTVGPLPHAMGDPTLLRQVWTNLLSNAIKFSSRQASPAIDVSAEEQEGETVYHVRDNGVGFDMRYVGKLFGVFQRLHSAKEFEGTGVGLAIVQRVVHRHGGRVWAEGEPRKGAAFSFTLGRGGAAWTSPA